MQLPLTIIKLLDDGGVDADAVKHNVTPLRAIISRMKALLRMVIVDTVRNDGTVSIDDLHITLLRANDGYWSDVRGGGVRGALHG